jgi:hypothetical protein
MEYGGRLFCLNKKRAPACSHWTDETVSPNTSAVLTLSLTERLSKLSCLRCDSNIWVRFFMGCNQVESGKLSLPLSTGQKTLTYTTPGSPNKHFLIGTQNIKCNTLSGFYIGLMITQ